jgi:hypothetical protein
LDASGASGVAKKRGTAADPAGGKERMNQRAGYEEGIRDTKVFDAKKTLVVMGNLKGKNKAFP